MVDEYQDTNFSQYTIVKKLAAAYQNICVVGDDAQSIYAFRGANIQNILNFESDYPELKVYKLEQNYRSTQNIVDVANSIIANNKNQLRKTYFLTMKPATESKYCVLLPITKKEKWWLKLLFRNVTSKGYNYNRFCHIIPYQCTVPSNGGSIAKAQCSL